MGLILHYDLKTRKNPELSDEVNSNPKMLLMLRLADVVITHACIDYSLFKLIGYFCRYLDYDIIKKYLNKRLSPKMKLGDNDNITREHLKSLNFENKRATLYELFNDYGVEYDREFLNMLKQFDINLIKFTKDLQRIERPRNNLAHKNTINEILLFKEKEEIINQSPELLNDDYYCELIGINNIGKTIDINETYHRYNMILAPYQYLLDMLNLDKGEDMVREILGMSTKKYITNEGDYIYA